MDHSLTIEQIVGQKLLLAFAGKDAPSAEILRAIQQYKPAGIRLLRALNIDNPAQVRQLTQSLQHAANEAGLPLLLIATDQEGGQLMAIGEGTTQLPGNLALGAAGSLELSYRAGQVLGYELAAMGININFAPCCDVNVNPQNPVVGTRSFGEEPQKVAELSVAMVRGIQSSGVAATAKHFPGHGDTASDSHHGLAIVPHEIDRLRKVELPPFVASIEAEVKLVMSAHLALPAIAEQDDLPATLSPAILKGLLREELKFKGVCLTDALDMQAIRQGEELSEDAVRAAGAGADLLLLGPDPVDQLRVYTGLMQATQRKRLEADELAASTDRVLELKHWISTQGPQPGLSVIGCAAHLAVADEIAAHSLTLVRDWAGILPLRLSEKQRLAVFLPRPQDLTPADTSSYVVPQLARVLRAYHPHLDEFVLPHAPQDRDIAAMLEIIHNYDLVIIGTLNAATQPGQAALVRTVLQTGIPTVVAALRMPYDLIAFPEAPTYICVYSILEPSMRALAKALWGQAEFTGRLPVSIPGLYSIGHGLAKAV